ncbi:MAG TPA: hypothetical protein VLI92_00355 [Candidatus Saccharimonadales bacterium]|nr:hypothetical protein [Candidatus Saccharimonadales bacterium]
MTTRIMTDTCSDQIEAVRLKLLHDNAHRILHQPNPLELADAVELLPLTVFNVHGIEVQFCLDGVRQKYVPLHLDSDDRIFAQMKDQKVDIFMQPPH